MIDILHLTTLHPRDDVRIMNKEARTLALGLSGAVTLMVADGLGHVVETSNRVSIYDLGKSSGGRIHRMLMGTIRAFFSILKLKVRVIHFHDPELIPLCLVLKLIGYKIVYDVHEDVPLQTLNKSYLPVKLRKSMSITVRIFESLGAMAFDMIITATPKISERFPPLKTITIQNFPILDEILQPKVIPYRERSFSVCYVGGISKVRGAIEMVSAFQLLSDFDGIRFDLAGTFNSEELALSSKLLSGWKYVHYYGQACRSTVGNILGQARVGLVLLHPIPNYLESQPIKMFEYMASGIPVIASDFPFWRQFIEQAKCGIMVDPLDPESIASAIRWIFDHPREAEQMGKYGQEAVKKYFNWDAEAPKLLDLYGGLLAS